MDNLKLKRIVIDKLLAIGIIKHGDFTLKSGIKSSVYFDFRQVISYPTIMNYICQLAEHIITSIKKEYPGRQIRFLGIPMGAIPLATFLSQYFGLPSIMLRKNIKEHGTRKILEGLWNPGDIIILVDDVFTSGTSLCEYIDLINTNIPDNGLDLTNIMIVCDRSKGASITKFPKLQSIFQLEDFEPLSPIFSSPIYQNSLANELYKIAFDKKSNIIVAADYSSKNDIIALIQKVGHLIAGIKLHIDIIHDADSGFFEELKILKIQHNIVIIEDIKAADISEITIAKLRNPRNSILEWADAITVHSISGLPKLTASVDIGLIPVVQMSCNSLISEEYTQRSLEMMREKDIEIAGCVIQNVGAMRDKWEFLGLTPGINLDTSASSADASSNQKYKNPLDAAMVGQFWIIGRGIISKPDVAAAAEEYRRIGWEYFVKY